MLHDGEARPAARPAPEAEAVEGGGRAAYLAAMAPSPSGPSPGEWLVGALGRLPESLARPVGRGLGALTRRPFRLRRRVVEEQIAAAFPGRPPLWVTDVARRCYRHFGEELLATAAVARGGPGALLDRVENLREIREVHRRLVGGGGCLVVTGHLGNWELAGGVLGGLGRPVVAVVRPQGGAAGAALRRLRRSLDIETVSMDRAAARLPSALAEGSVVALVADQNAAARGIVVPFLDSPASTFRGPARLALALETPLLFGALLRWGGGYRARLEPVADPGSGDGAPGEGERALTRAWLARLEGAIRRHPAQYFWFHRRWKPLPAPERRPPAGGRNGTRRHGGERDDVQGEDA